MTIQGGATGGQPYDPGADKTVRADKEEAQVDSPASSSPTSSPNSIHLHVSNAPPPGVDARSIGSLAQDAIGGMPAAAETPSWNHIVSIAGQGSTQIKIRQQGNTVSVDIKKKNVETKKNIQQLAKRLSDAKKRDVGSFQKIYKEEIETNPNRTQILAAYNRIQATTFDKLPPDIQKKGKELYDAKMRDDGSFQQIYKEKIETDPNRTQILDAFNRYQREQEPSTSPVPQREPAPAAGRTLEPTESEAEFTAMLTQLEFPERSADASAAESPRMLEESEEEVDMQTRGPGAEPTVARDRSAAAASSVAAKTPKEEAIEKAVAAWSGSDQVSKTSKSKRPITLKKLKKQLKMTKDVKKKLLENAKLAAGAISQSLDSIKELNKTVEEFAKSLINTFPEIKGSVNDNLSKISEGVNQLEKNAKDRKTREYTAFNLQKEYQDSGGNSATGAAKINKELNKPTQQVINPSIVNIGKNGFNALVEQLEIPQKSGQFGSDMSPAQIEENLEHFVELSGGDHEKGKKLNDKFNELLNAKRNSEIKPTEFLRSLTDFIDSLPLGAI